MRSNAAKSSKGLIILMNEMISILKSGFKCRKKRFWKFFISIINLEISSYLTLFYRNNAITSALKLLLALRCYAEQPREVF